MQYQTSVIRDPCIGHLPDTGALVLMLMVVELLLLQQLLLLPLLFFSLLGSMV